MKNYLLLTIASFMMLATVQAQHVNIGIKGGLNVYTLTGSNNTNNSAKIAYNLGLLGHIHLNKKFALQPEIVYSVQGTKFKSNNVVGDVQLNYFNVPILLQYMYDNGFRLEFGPQFSALSSATQDKTNVKSYLKNLDFGVAVGMSYVKPSTGWGVDLRYNHGLTNINDNNTFKNYNRGIQLGLFCLFQHKS